MPADVASAGLRYAYRLLVTAAALLIIYAVYDALRLGEPNPTAKALLVTVGVLALAAAIAAWSRHSIAISVQVVAIPFLAALYLFEARQQDPVDAMMHVKEFWSIVRAKVAGGQPVTIQLSPQNFAARPEGALILANGERIFPLSGVANLPTVMCREGQRPFAEYEADEYGFNNPKGIWGKPVDIVLIGDSMTYGACVANRDHFVAQIRERYPATLNLGNGGIGPLVELAIMRELVPHVRPKYVFFVYDENNDLYFVKEDGEADLAIESRHPILRKYLDDRQFSQRVLERHGELDAVLKRHVEDLIARSLQEHTRWKSLLGLLSLRLTRAALPKDGLSFSGILPAPAMAAPAATGEDVAASPPAPAEPDQFALFQQIFTQAIEISRQAGARLVFVNIPAQKTVCDGIEHPLRRPVLDFVLNTGVDFVDLEQDFRNADKMVGRERLFAVPPCGGHFSEAGYKIIGDRLVQYLAYRERLAASGTNDVPADARRHGWSYSGHAGRGGEQAAAQVVWTETQRYEPQVKFSALFADPSRAPTQTDGASILGKSYKRQRGGNGLRITLKFSAYSEQDNEIVAALFVKGEATSSRFAAQPVKAGTFASVTLTYETDRLSDAIFDIQVRVGARGPGMLHTNADGHGPNPDVSSFLKVEELWLATQSLHADQLIYRGEPLGEQDLLKAQRTAAKRMRDREPGALTTAVQATRLWFVRQVARRKVFQHEQEYKTYVSVDRVIDRQDGMAVDLEGAAIMGYSWQPRSAGDLVRVKITVPAWADHANSIVAALFVNGEIATRKVDARELSPGQVAPAMIEFDMTAPSTEPIGLSVRVGAGRPGKVFLNGDATGPVHAIPKPKLVIEEYRSLLTAAWERPTS